MAESSTRTLWHVLITGVRIRLEEAAKYGDLEEQVEVLTGLVPAIAEELRGRVPTTERPKVRTMAEIERDAIEQAIKDNGGNRVAAAKQLGISTRTVFLKLKQWSVQHEPQRLHD